MVQALSVLFLNLIIYSFLGWVVETIYCSVLDGHFVKRGFLNGPICPIYGFGSLFVLSALAPYINSILAVFILGMISTSILEYITSYIMEKLFKMKWWDYTDYKFNIRGRVCLRNSVMFGILCVILTKVINPIVKVLVDRIPITMKYASAVVLFFIFTLDIIVSVISVINLNQKFEFIYLLKEQIREKLDKENVARKLDNIRESRDNFIGNKLDSIKAFRENLAALKQNMDIDKLEMAFREKLRALQTENKYFERRLLLAFPKLKSKKHNETLQEIRNAMKEFRGEH